MESIFKLYFGNGLARNRVVMTIIYLLSMVMVVNGLLGWFGIHYSFPKEITLATAFNFLFSAQILYPLAGFFIYYTITVLFTATVINYLYQRYKYFLFRTYSDDGIIDTVRNELWLQKFITLNFTPDLKFGQPQRGTSYHLFEPFLKTKFWDDFNLIAAWKLSTNSMFAVSLALLFNYKQHLVIQIAFYISLVGWVCFTLVYWRLVRQGEYQQVYEQYYFNVTNPLEAKTIERVPTGNKHYKKFQAWESKHKLKKRYKRWCEIRKKKAISGQI